MFLDDVEYLSFFRRLSWSPDGSFFLTPASVFQDLSAIDSANGATGTIKTQYTIYGFIKSDITQPAFMLPGIKSYATCIKFSQHLYKLKGTATPERPAILDLPYRMIFAVGTNDQVLIYSTECVYPLAVIGNTHYATINDLAWDAAGRKLLCASSDGYISVISLSGEASVDLMGERMPTADPTFPEKLKGLFEASESVSYKKFEEEARDGKKNQFTAVKFKSKNAGGTVVVTQPIAPAGNVNNNGEE